MQGGGMSREGTHSSIDFVNIIIYSGNTLSTQNKTNNYPFE
ncbi:hypothetical protein PORCRE_1030 [Porphyromonas crevioricanis JCM 15906]|uniref:Uncharacterized protein n=1 Tax=Porphyromonas crevioricanis JCM 15906 TaxID=1305617 RepID=T1DRL7_9PORP|nr:hypothetical protein PORCRE_1030 [Porphyromonas crevioricanis JCM 15906]GAD08234.1 hypothetical protein PORCAN_1870 [Porphyromonas crevioricanis JCM 13913]